MLSTMSIPARDARLVQIRDAQLVRIVDASLIDAARRAGDFLACRIGCTQCCHGAFAINALDATRLHKGMSSLRTTNPALAAEIELRARAWLAEHGPGFPGNPETGALGTSEADQAQFEDFANDAACPALDPSTGRCDVYEWRPMTCRVFGPPVRSAGENGVEGLGHCELCFIGATPEQVAACEMPVPHELEAELLEEIAAKSGSQIDSQDETVVAFALLR
jgi:Fe-S-cluster containining protein